MKSLLLCLWMLMMLSACHTFTPVANGSHDKKMTAAGINIQLGMAYLERREIQRAKQKFLLALHEAPQLPEAWYSIGYFFEITGDKPRAARCYLRALELAPHRGDTNNNYGTFLCRTHHYKTSIKYFLAATQDVEYLDTAAAYENAGLCAQLIPDANLAMKYYEDALKQDPNRPASLLGLAQLNYQRGNYAESNSLLQQFLALSPATAESKQLKNRLVQKEVHHDD